MSLQSQTRSNSINKSVEASAVFPAVKQPFSRKRGFSTEAQRYRVQTKLRIGQPGDKYEKEADRIAETVMMMPDSAFQWKPGRTLTQDPSCGGKELVQAKPVGLNITPLIQRQPVEEEEEEVLQTKEISGHPVLLQTGIQAQLNAMHGGGQPLAESTRKFFERRFEYDFSPVRVHTDTRAAQSANEVNAQAYTVGRDIVFNTGMYSPGTTAGQRLLAHELTHTIQQGSTKWKRIPDIDIESPKDKSEIASRNAEQQVMENSTLKPAKHSFVHLRRGTDEPEDNEEPLSRRAPGVTIARKMMTPIIQRRARALWPVDRWENPAARIVRGDDPAITELEMNGQLIQDGTDLDAAIPTPSFVARPTADSGHECKIRQPIDMTCRNRRIMPWADQNGAWWSRIDLSTLQEMDYTQCTGVSAPRGVLFKLTARPSARALTRRLIRSEYEHVMDTFEIFRAHLVPLHDLYAHYAANPITGPDPTSCATAILTDIDRNRYINSFIEEYNARRETHDGPEGDHHTDAPMRVNQTCTLAHAEAIV